MEHLVSRGIEMQKLREMNAGNANVVRIKTTGHEVRSHRTIFRARASASSQRT